MQPTRLSVSINRRKMFQLTSAAMSTAASSTIVTARSPAKELSSAKRCLLLWMDGGQSQTDSFDPKPEAGSQISGEFSAISTKLSGVHFSERWGKLAARADQLAILRGMCTEEADHGRARIYMHTGFRPGQGGLNYPTLGALVSAELGQHDSILPNFVATGVPLGKYDFVTDCGYRGPRHAALVHYDPRQPLAHVTPAVAAAPFSRRMEVLREINAEYAQQSSRPVVEGHRAVQERAARLMTADAAAAFDLTRESERQHERYGRHSFGQGCLLARRLIESGVRFVEVYQGNWDTHEAKVVAEARDLMPAVDHAVSTLLDDLSERGLLDETLLILMGEFGRTPRVNNVGGRDHFAKAWTTILAGGGLRTGQVIGSTDATGSEVIDRSISARNYLATICQALDIDYTRQVPTPIGRNVGIVDQGGTPLAELF